MTHISMEKNKFDNCDDVFSQVCMDIDEECLQELIITIPSFRWLWSRPSCY